MVRRRKVGDVRWLNRFLPRVAETMLSRTGWRDTGLWSDGMMVANHMWLQDCHELFSHIIYAYQEVYMHTYIVLNDDLITEAMQLANVKTKREVVDIALRRFVAS